MILDFVKPEVIQSLRDMHLHVYVYKTPKSFEEVRQCIRFWGAAVMEKERGERRIFCGSCQNSWQKQLASCQKVAKL